ncbi:MAG: fibrobacter succinogenes major paralogous domain-containing protein [Bacteroidales bacterium]
MKTIQIIFLALFFSASLAMAQDTLYVYKAGAVAYKSVISAVDSVTFQKVYPPVTTVTDFDGNVYHTIVIGTQTWMVENLKTTHYRNGSPIDNVTDNALWAGLSTGAWCNYDNNPANGTKYGCLYNWAAVGTGNLAPAGWHVPTDADWTTLTDFLGAVAANKLMEAGTTNWQAPNTGATNETGFTALPNGFRGSDGGFSNIGVLGYWWSSTSFPDGTTAWCRGFAPNQSFVGADHYNRLDGFSVRLIKN